MTRLESCYFGSDGQWTRLARVLASSAAQQCPSWAIHVQRVAPPTQASRLGLPRDAANTLKLTVWARIVDQAADGDRLLLIDADTMILRPLDAAWEEDFDLAYTVKAGARFPFNAGVTFVRVSAPVRAFLQSWEAENLRMLRDPSRHYPWRRIYGGINQASLGCLLASAHGLKIAQLPCLEWNCEDASWGAFDPARTRIVHVKSLLRQTVFGSSPRPSELTPLAHLWRQLDADIGQEGLAS